MESLLFLCTGNYYRSRFAEEYFNHRAADAGLPLRADSKGFARDMVTTGNVGPISPHTIAALEALDVPIVGRRRYPLSVTDLDFETYSRVLLLSAREHSPMLQSQFDRTIDNVRILAFDIEDWPIEMPATALPRLKERLDDLLGEISRDR